MMTSLLALNWWTLTIRGVAAILFGVIALNWPVLTLGFVTALFGVFCFVDGIFSIISGFRRRHIASNWGIFILEGLLSVGAGLIAFRWPQVTLLILTYLIAFWALSRGIIGIVAAIQLRKVIRGEALLGIIGLLSVAFGIATLIWPLVGAFALVGLVSAYMIMQGAFQVALSLRMKDEYQTFLKRNTESSLEAHKVA